MAQARYHNSAAAALAFQGQSLTRRNELLLYSRSRTRFNYQHNDAQFIRQHGGLCLREARRSLALLQLDFTHSVRILIP